MALNVKNPHWFKATSSLNMAALNSAGSALNLEPVTLSFRFLPFILKKYHWEGINYLSMGPS